MGVCYLNILLGLFTPNKNYLYLFTVAGAFEESHHELLTPGPQPNSG